MNPNKLYHPTSFVPSFVVTILFAFMCCALATAQQEPSVVEEMTGLTNPVCVAAQPDSGEIFVATLNKGDCHIFQRIAATTPDGEASMQVVANLEVETDSEAGSMAFLSNKKLVVALGDKLSVFNLAKPLPFGSGDSESTHKIKETTTSPKLAKFNSLTFAHGDLYWNTKNDPNRWLGNCVVANGNVTKKTNRWLPLGDTIPEGMLPSSMTLAPDGHLLVGATDTDKSSSAIYFVGTKQKAVRANFSVPQSGLAALAYSPNTGRLFALFRSDDAPDTEGLYKLVARKRNTECEARLVAKIAKPTSMAFSADGTLWITTGGDEGKLLRVDRLDPVASDELNKPATKSDQ